MARPQHYRSAVRSQVIPLRDWAWKLTFFVLLLLSLALIGLSRSDHEMVVRLRTGLSDVFTPIVHAISQPAEYGSAMVEKFDHWVSVYEQNRQLTVDNQDLRRWRQLASELEAENRAMRQLLRLAPIGGKVHYLTSRILGDVTGPYSQSVFLGSGLNQSVIRNMAVINGDGLVGRVIDAGESTSRVLLLTDINSRVSVIGESSRERAVATGRNKPRLELAYLPEDTKMQVGEQIVTTGDAGLMPAGIPVGTVNAIEDGKVLVTPLVDWSRLDYVSLIATADSK